MLLNGGVRCGDCIFELTQPEQCAAQLEVSLRKRRAPLLGCGAYRFDGAGQVALLDQHAAKLELSIGVVAVSLIQRLAKGTCRLFQLAPPRERDAQVMPCFWELAVALLDRAIERIDGFVEIAAPKKSNTKVMIGPRMIAAALLDGFAICVDRFGVLSAPSERESERVVGIRVLRLLLD